MYEYQKTHNIVKKCIVNTVYLLDTMRANGHNANAKAVLATGNLKDNEKYICIHMVIEYNGYIIDPSYEINSTVETYVDKLHTILHNYKNTDIYKEGLSPKEVVTGFIDFMNIAKLINKGNTMSDSDNKKYYHSQADYIEDAFNQYTSKGLSH